MDYTTSDRCRPACTWTNHFTNNQTVFVNLGESRYHPLLECLHCLVQDYVEVRQFERAVRDAEGKLAQVSSYHSSWLSIICAGITFRLLNRSTSRL